MNPLRFVTSSLLLIITVFSGMANGDPVIRFSSISSAANPEPLSISEISIVGEKLRVTHVNGYNCFDVTYELQNNSDKDFPEIHYGFPVDYFINDSEETVKFVSDGISESDYEGGWHENLIKDVSFTFDGSPLDFHASKESVREAGYVVDDYYCDSLYQEGINRRWFYTLFSMAPRSKAMLNVRYMVYAQSTTSMYAIIDGLDSYMPENSYCQMSRLKRFMSGSFTILYNFSPAKHFGDGKSFPIDLTIDLSNLDDLWISKQLDGKGYDGTWYHANMIKEYISGTPAAEIPPLQFICNYNPAKTVDKLNDLLSPFIIPESEYETEQSEDGITVNFSHPTLITDILFHADSLATSAVNLCIQYADGTTHTSDFKRHGNYEVTEGFPSIITLITHDNYQLYKGTPEDTTNLTSKPKPEKIKSITLTTRQKKDSPITIPANLRFLDVKPLP